MDKENICTFSAILFSLKENLCDITQINQSSGQALASGPEFDPSTAKTRQVLHDFAYTRHLK